MTEVAEVCQLLAGSCASTAMVYAMHQIQIACLVRHAGDSAFVRGYLETCCERQRLIASATSEIGVGGDMRTSNCAVERGRRRRHAREAGLGDLLRRARDDILVTARRDPEAAPSDQVLRRCSSASEYHARRSSATGTRWACAAPAASASWCSATATPSTCCPCRSRDISAADDAPGLAHPVDARVARHRHLGRLASRGSYVRAEARKKPGTMPPNAMRAGRAGQPARTCCVAPSATRCTSTSCALRRSPRRWRRLGFSDPHEQPQDRRPPSRWCRSCWPGDGRLRHQRATATTPPTRSAATCATRSEPA